MHYKTSGLQEILRLFYLISPGIILAVVVTGSSAITILPRSGGAFGYALLWIVPVALIYKFALTYGIARYTIIHGENIFKGLKEVPGPENWALILILLEYTFEMLAIGSLALLAGTALNGLVPIIPAKIGTFLTIALMIAVLGKGSYAGLEKLILGLFVLIVLVIIYFLSILPISYENVARGFVPSVPYSSLLEIMALVGWVGGGIGILNYSCWLKEITGDKAESGEIAYSKLNKRVRLDLGISYIFIGAFACAFIIIGSFAFYMDVMLPESEILKSALKSLDFITYGSTIFLLLTYLALFGAILGNLDGRSRVLASSIKMMKKISWDETDLYKAAIFFLGLIMLSVVFFGEPNQMIRIIASMASLIFAILGLIVIYIDSTLPIYAKGSKTWLMVMTGGSMYFLAVNLLKEQTVIEFGIPLLERAAVILFVFFLFAQTETMKKAFSSLATGTELAWIVILFGSLSIYGSLRGIAFGGYLINIRDLGAIMAGVIGGPFAGAVAGAFGGAFRYTQGGWTAVPCAVATVFAGILSGLMTNRWNGQLTYAKGIFLAIVAEMAHLLIIAPLFLGIGPEVQALIRTTLLPMITANAFGMVFFVYIMELMKRKSL
jgi:Mn2+/Fe2+ NRAMP family transporter